MALLIGSAALQHSKPRFPRCGDYDIIIAKNEFQQWASSNSIPYTDSRKIIINQFDKKIEFEFEDLQSNQLLLNRKYDKQTEIYGIKCFIADLDTLFAIKRSHRYYEQHWHKNIKDYLFLKHFCTLTDELRSISDIREAEQAKKHFKPNRSLEVSNDDFFSKSQHIVQRTYVHDDLHYATCYYDKPLWTRCKYDQSKATISEELFNKLSHEDQVKMVQEEAFVIALERKIIPNNVDPKAAFRWAVMRIGTSLTKGWFRDFTINNYHAVIRHNHNYVGLFQKALTESKINKV